jgi:hypothetical protein
VSDEKPTPSKRPTVRELAADITGSHRVQSDPPGLRWLDRRIGRAIRVSLTWIVTTKGGSLLIAAVSSFLTWLSQHLWHWIR